MSVKKLVKSAKEFDRRFDEGEDINDLIYRKIKCHRLYPAEILKLKQHTPFTLAPAITGQCGTR